MPSVLEAALAHILFTATQCTTGLIVRTNDVRRAKAVIYRYRKELGDPELMKIQVRISPTNPETDLWLLRMKEDQIDE